MPRVLGLAVVLTVLAATAEASPKWTFCVAAAGSGDVWISEVFEARASREWLEGAFKSEVERLGTPGASTLCPNPRADKTIALNAQIDAQSFNEKMGASLHAVPASAFPGIRGGAVVGRRR